ncbi:cytochrome c [Hymenobacter sp. BT507]|uniref:Cytochrome c n=1 Tax=Hymenobacter citatus TaxID=2763506 RepID=A0ABR7MGX1_9BACT|nr:cytochrome c [Hymenobacter citatus]MBC6610327.1 cytochrome c [Hymenobacter citatus]
MLRPLPCLLSSLLLLAGCVYDHADEPVAPTPTACDTATATYALFVSPLLDQRCRSCHNAQFPQGGANLADLAQVQRYARNGTLLGVVSHAAGYPAMPKNGPKLSDCEITRLKKWIDDGALNN